MAHVPEVAIVRATHSLNPVGLLVSFLHPGHFGQPSHVEFYTKTGDLLGSSPATKGVNYGDHKSFHTWSTYREVYHLFPVHSYGAVINLAEDLIGAKYDYRGVLREIFNLDWRNELHSWYCSEFIAYILEQTNRDYNYLWKDVAISPYELLKHSCKQIDKATYRKEPSIFRKYGYPTPPSFKN